ncbi:MAG TPA: MMPL family transporter, partial [Pararhizobium sp.]|nr:MMPL family transporter [Pararhizobium sp.]
PPTRRLITVQPVLNNGALMPGEAATEAIRSAQNELGLGPANGVTVRLTGEVPLADEEFATLSSNVDVVGIVMLLAMVVTLWIATHSTRIVAAIVTATIAGLVVTTALGLMMVGTFNLISVAFIPLFVGLGVDFGIQISVRFAAERWYGKNTADALRHAADRLAAPLLLAAAAIFLGFGAFLPTAYVGIAQLGLIAGVGMVIAFLFSVTLLPALLMCLRPGIPPREVGFAGAEPLDRFLVRQRRFVIASFVIATIASIAMLPLLRFDFNPMHLRNPNAPAMRTLTDLTHDPDRTPNTINVLADNPQQAAALAKKLAALPEVRAAITLQDFVPEKQPAKLAMIEAAARQLAPVLQPATAPAPSDAQTIEALGEAATRLRSAAAHLPAKVAGPVGKLADAFESIATATPAVRRHAGEVVSQPLKTMLGQLRMAMQAEPVTADSLPESLQRDWQAPNGKSRIQVLPSGKSNDNQTLRRFRDAVASVTPNISGLPVATQAAASTIANAFIQAGFIALLLIGGLLYLVLRSVREVAFTLAPVVLSGFLTLATCVLIGQPINFANIIAFPLLFGVGVAFHIYFVMAWRAGATNLLQSSLARAVLFSALATGTAFGSLWLSHHPGTASMGKLLMISLGWTLVCALIFEPALLGPPPPPQERHGISPEDLEAE